MTATLPVVVWSGNHIGHHSSVMDHCFITSHAVISGNVHVGAYSFLGVNATLREGISIGEACVIGARALVMKSTSDHDVYVGNRTPPHSKRSDQIGM